MNIEINDYIVNMNSDWNKLSSMRKLTQEEIKSIPNNNIQMYLYCYYDYPELRSYNTELLKRNNDCNINYLIISPFFINYIFRGTF